MQKRGRPAAPFPTEQVAIQLDRAMLEELRTRAQRRGHTLAAEIRDRLMRSLDADQTDPHLQKLQGQIKELSREVRFALEAEWYEDQKAHQTFLEILRRLFSDLPEPKTQHSESKVDPATAADWIYGPYIRKLRAFEAGKKVSIQTSPSLKGPGNVGQGLDQARHHRKGGKS